MTTIAPPYFFSDIIPHEPAACQLTRLSGQETPAGVPVSALSRTGVTDTSLHLAFT